MVDLTRMPEVDSFPTVSDVDQEKQPYTGQAITLDQDERNNENVVDSDGLDDPMIALNWKPVKKWRRIAVLALMTFIS